MLPADNNSLTEQEDLLLFKMKKMWSFSTLQRPTQEEKERKRRYREEQRKLDRSYSTTNRNNTTSRVGRAKTFRQFEQERHFANSYGSDTSNILEALKYRAKSATRGRDQNENYISMRRRDQSLGSRYRDPSVGTKSRNVSIEATSRLRFLDKANNEMSSSAQPNGRLRWFDRDDIQPGDILATNEMSPNEDDVYNIREEYLSSKKRDAQVDDFLDLGYSDEHEKSYYKAR